MADTARLGGIAARFVLCSGEKFQKRHLAKVSRRVAAGGVLRSRSAAGFCHVLLARSVLECQIRPDMEISPEQLVTTARRFSWSRAVWMFLLTRVAAAPIDKARHR